MLVHGFRAHARWWDFIAPFFTATHRVFAPDLLGMGDSDDRRGSPYSALNFALDVVALIEHECLAPAILVGHSVGGARALRAAAERPDLVARVIAVDTGYRFDDVHESRWRSPPIRRRTYADADTAAARFRLTPDDGRAPAWVHDYVARHSLRRVVDGWTWKWDERLPVGTVETDVAELLARVQVPVDYLYGEYSTVVRPDIAARIVGLLPRGRGPIAIPGAWHHVPLDQPLALVAALRCLLA